MGADGGEKCEPLAKWAFRGACPSSFHDGIASFAAKVSGYLKSPRPKFDLLAVQAESAKLRDLVRDSRRRQLDRVGPDDPSSPIRVLVELDILNAYERIRGYYLNIAETLAGGKG